MSVHRGVLSAADARLAPACFACGGRKLPGWLVCDDCFKWTDKFTPFKYFAGTFESWQVREVHPYWEEVKAAFNEQGERVVVHVIAAGQMIEPGDLL